MSVERIGVEGNRVELRRVNNVLARLNVFDLDENVIVSVTLNIRGLLRMAADEFPEESFEMWEMFLEDEGGESVEGDEDGGESVEESEKGFPGL